MVARVSAIQRRARTRFFAPGQCRSVPVLYRFAESELRGPTMLDIVMLAIVAGFFAISMAYVYACERL
jgi:hypothetical protein